jgi:hypothetical protein
MVPHDNDIELPSPDINKVISFAKEDLILHNSGSPFPAVLLNRMGQLVSQKKGQDILTIMELQSVRDRSFYMIMDDTGALKVIDLYDYSFENKLSYLSDYVDKRTFIRAGEYLDNSTSMLKSPKGWFYTYVDYTTDALQVRDYDVAAADPIIFQLIPKRKGTRVTLTKEGDYQVRTYNNQILWSLDEYLSRKIKYCWRGGRYDGNCNRTYDEPDSDVEVQTDFDKNIIMGIHAFWPEPESRLVLDKYGAYRILSKNGKQLYTFYNNTDIKHTKRRRRRRLK